MLLVNTFDLEPWWATVPPCVPLDKWGRLEDRSAQPLENWLALCQEARVRCTFFVVGWYADRYPERIRQIVSLGHEIGSHTYWHEDVAQFDLGDIAERLRRDRMRLEDTSGVRVKYFRAPSFSLPVTRLRSFLRAVRDAGFEVDSSVSTARRVYGGGVPGRWFPSPGRIDLGSGDTILEIPVPGVDFAGTSLQLLGGGYLRAVPLGLLKRLLRGQGYQVLYMHPHDFDPELPNLPGARYVDKVRRRFRQGDLSAKVRWLFGSFRVLSCGQVLQEIDEVNGELHYMSGAQSRIVD